MRDAPVLAADESNVASYGFVPILNRVFAVKENPTPPRRTATPFDLNEQRQLAVIMFTDMVGYSALTQRDEPLALQLLEEHRGIVRPLLTAHGGREIKTIGDAFLVEFSSALAAVTCAIEIQRSFHAHNAAAPAERQLKVRIGLHAGDVVHKENDVFGDGVNIASRIEPLAEPGGICLSEDMARQIQNKIECPLRPLGLGELKNIAMAVVVYRIVLPWEAQRPRLAQRVSFLLAKKSTRRAFAAVAVGAMIVGAWLGRGRWLHAEPGPVSRIAVLPLRNIGGNLRDEYFADGMTEELISSLATIRELSVIARTSVAKFKGAQLDVAEIGGALNVGSILEGSVRVAGDEARINVSLVDVRTQRTVWRDEFTRELKDIFAIQTAIAMSVTEALKVQLFSGEKTLLERRGSSNSDAYREYLLGRSQLNKRTGDEIVKAIESFSRAIDRDGAFALAYAGLAEGYTLAGNAGYGSLPREQAIERARARAHQAIALDESLAEAHAALGYVKFRIDWDWPGAEASFKRALELKPGYARAHETYALFLGIEKRFPEAMAEMRRAQQLDPLSPGPSNGIGRLLHFEHRFDEAVDQFKKTIALDPQFAEAHFSLGITYEQLGRYDDALTALKKAAQLSGNRQVHVAMLAFTLAEAGRRDEARKIYDEMLAQAKTTHVSPYYFGIISAGLGDLDRAFEYFEQAYAERDGILIYLGVDPIGEKIWPDPRFVALIKKMGLKP